VSYLIVCSVALFASALTFFSGFGLGTLLLPAFAFIVPIEHAVALTAIVHFLNGIFKVFLVGRHADRGVVLRFGVPAIAASFAGAWVLNRLANAPPLIEYPAFGREFAVSPVKLVVGVILIAFALIEVVPKLRDLQFDRRWMPIGGLLSGFFGGLAGMQGALRSAFLARAGLTKESFIGTGAVIACLIDVTRLGVYASSTYSFAAHFDYPLLTAAVAAAFVGATLGNRWLKKTTMRGVQRIVAVMLFLVGLGLISGLL